VKPNKNDARDAEAICEAVGRPSMRFVAVNSLAQEDMLALHRVRSLLVRERTALMNQNALADAGACEMVLVKSDGRPLEAGEFCCLRCGKAPAATNSRADARAGRLASCNSAINAYT
jgi:transposase